MDKTLEVYNYIEAYISKNNYPPTIREMCDHLHFDSTSSVVYHLKKLENMGKITRSENKNRAIEVYNIYQELCPELNPIILFSGCQDYKENYQHCFFLLLR